MGLGSFCSKKNNKLETIQPKNLKITGVQRGFLQFLEIYQTIQSTEDLNEVVYIFPTDNKFCIYNMKFQVGDETINAELRSKKTAEETFKEAIKTRRTAAMTEEISTGITSIKIGNVPKGKDVTIIFQCALTTTLQNSKTILMKIPLQASEPDGSLTDLYNLPSLDIDVDISITQVQPISNVYANCESNYEKIDDKNGKLKIQNAIFTDENIIVLTELNEPIESQIVQSKSAALLSVIPDFESEKSDSKEFVFLIDCSASMLGESIRKAKESLHLFITKLSDSSYFNIICFGTKYVKLFPSSEKKSVSTIEKAKDFIEKIRANLGGTEMLNMLTEVFQNEVKIGGQRQIFLVTDGEVYERSKVVQKVEENNGFNRIFAIGLGHGADAGFLDEITEITKGKSDFVFNKDELPTKVNEHFELSLVDSATDVEVHIEGNDSFQAAPYPLNPLLPHVVSHIFISSNLPIENVMVSGKLKDNEIESIISRKLEWPENENEKINTSPIFALFAQKQLKKIEDDEEKSVKLSLSSGVLSKYTSYIAVSEKIHVDKEPTKIGNESDDEDEDEDHDRIIRSGVSRYRGGRRGGRRGSAAFHVYGCLKARKKFSKPKAEDPDEEEEEEIKCKKAIRRAIKESSTDESDDDLEVGASIKMSKRKPMSKAHDSSDSDELEDEEEEIVKTKASKRKSMPKKSCDSSEEEEEEKSYKCKTAVKAKKCKKLAKRKPRVAPPRKAIKESSTDESDDDVEDGASIEMSKRKPMSKKSHDSSDSDELKDEEEEIARIDESKIWNDSASVIDIIRHQTRDGFWDLPSSFISKKLGGKSFDIGINLEESPLIKKRVFSTVFAIGYLSRFHSENENKWKFAMEKALKWLERINSTLNWREIIANNMSLITK